jgi:hypothetical protein
MKKLIFTLLISFLAISLYSQEPDHAKWDALLKKHVSPQGKVNYKTFKADKDKLEEYLKNLSDNMPKSNWTEDQKKAYWMNTYNAAAVKLILDNYPTKSIQDIGGFKKPWHIKFISLGGKMYDLNTIEHEILRKQFNDPRIHVGINCASYSCPKLHTSAFTAANTNTELEKLMKEFINDPSKNKISANNLELSQIFNWFKEDFTKTGNLIDYLNKYSNIKINANAKISYLKYNWSLNE